MKRRGPVFRSESELCEEFSTALVAVAAGVYPEVDGWDLLLVIPRSSDAFPRSSFPADRSDFRVGVEAKLRPSIEVLYQAMDRVGRPRGPDAALVLVPTLRWQLRGVAMRLGLGALDLEAARSRHRLQIEFSSLTVYPRMDGELLEPPRFVVPHLRAGQPSPRPLTKWRESAIRLCLRLRERGFVTSLDFRELGVSPRWWTETGALRRDGDDGRRRRYVVADATKLPDVGWESVAEQIRASIAERGAA